MKKLLFIILHFLLVLSLQAQSIQKITIRELIMWEQPDSLSKAVGVIPLGTTITIEEDCDCKWIPVEYDDKIGYVATRHLISPEDLVILLEESRFYVANSNLNVRTSPSTRSSVLGNFNKGQTIYVNKITGDWAEVTISSSEYGSQTAYVHKNYLSRASKTQITHFKNKQNYSTATPTGGVKYYTNSYGERVQSPTHYNSQPKGATALCRDGTYSFSRSRRGTCSHHGGVAQWL